MAQGEHIHIRVDSILLEESQRWARLNGESHSAYVKNAIRDRNLAFQLRARVAAHFGVSAESIERRTDS